MNSPTNNKVASLSLQNVPGSGIPVSLLRKIAADLRSAHLSDFSIANVAAIVARSLPAPLRNKNTAIESVSFDPHSPMGRINEIILREVQMFKRAADDLLEVALTPDAKTQISLRLAWHEGQVEALARCDLGDYPAFNAQWPQLQATLAHHGVRLAPLSRRVSTGFTDCFNNPDFAPPHRGDRGASRETQPGNAVATPLTKSPEPVLHRVAGDLRQS